MTGVFISYNGDQATIECGGIRSVFTIAPSCKIIRNGDPCTLADLEPGDLLIVNGRPRLTSIWATGP